MKTISSDGLSLSSLRREQEELRKDYVAFSKAYDTIRHRIIDSTESTPRTPMLHEWSGSRAVIGSLELSIHSIERTIVEYGELIKSIEAGEIPNLDKRPALGVLDGGIK